METNQVSGVVVDAAMKAHSALAPGLLESAYETWLIRELRKRGLRIESQVPIAVRYDGEILDVGYRADLLVEGLVLVELKSVETIADPQSSIALLPPPEWERSWFTHQFQRGTLEERNQTGYQLTTESLCGYCVVCVVN